MVVRQHAWCRILFVTALLAPSSPISAAENWPQWRGPLAGGVAAEGDYPVEFSSDKNVAWKLALPGVGCSTPVVWGPVVECAWVTTGRGDRSWM